MMAFEVVCCGLEVARTNDLTGEFEASTEGVDCQCRLQLAD